MLELRTDTTDPTSIDQTSIDPTSTDQTSTDPTSTDPTSTDQTSTDQTSTNDGRDEHGRHPRRPFVWLGLGAIGLGIAVLAYDGPGQPFVRGHVGDVASTMLVFAFLSLVMRRSRAWARGLVTMAIATAVELMQIGSAGGDSCGDGSVGDFVFGATFDWIDFGAYVVGIGIAMAWERLVLSSPRWTPALAGTKPRFSAPAGSRFGEPSAPVARASSIAPSTSSSDAKSRSST